MHRIKNVQTGQYLMVVNDNPNNGVFLHCGDKGCAQSQLWTIVPATDPKYAGKNAYHLRSIFGKALESPGDSLNNDVQMQQGDFKCADGQTFVIKEIWMNDLFALLILIIIIDKIKDALIFNDSPFLFISLVWRQFIQLFL